MIMMFNNDLNEDVDYVDDKMDVRELYSSLDVVEMMMKIKMIL